MCSDQENIDKSDCIGELTGQFKLLTHFIDSGLPFFSDCLFSVPKIDSQQV